MHKGKGRKYKYILKLVHRGEVTHTTHAEDDTRRDGFVVQSLLLLCLSIGSRLLLLLPSKFCFNVSTDCFHHLTKTWNRPFQLVVQSSVEVAENSKESLHTKKND